MFGQSSRALHSSGRCIKKKTPRRNKLDNPNPLLFLTLRPSEGKTSAINRVAGKKARKDFRDWLLLLAKDKAGENGKRGGGGQDEGDRKILKNVKKGGGSLENAAACCQVGGVTADK